MSASGSRPETLLSYRLLRALAGRAGDRSDEPPSWSWRKARVGRLAEATVRALRPFSEAPLRLLDRLTTPLARRPLAWIAAAVLALAIGRLAWPAFEANAVTVGALFVALSAALLGFAAALHTAQADRRVVLRLLALGVLLRVAFAVLLGLRGGFPDEWGTYFPIARDSAACWSHGGASLLGEHPFVENRATFFYALSGAFFVAGPALSVGRVLGGAIGLLAALAAGECARAVAGRRAALIAVGLLALHPEHALWSATLSRDSLTVLLVLVTLAAIARRPGTLTRGTLAVVLVPLGLLWWNGFLFAALLALVVLLMATCEAFHRAGRSWRGALLAAATIAAVGVGLTAIGARLGPWLRPDLVSIVRTAGIGDSADFLPGLQFETWFDVAAYAPAGAVYVLLAPLPWDVVHANRLFYALLAVPGLAVTLLGIVGLGRLGLRRAHRAAPLVLYAGATLLALALLEGVTGILVRHRLSLTAVLAIGAAALLARARSGTVPGAVGTP